MNEIKKQDAKNLALSLAQPVPLIVVGVCGYVAYKSLALESAFGYLGWGLFVAGAIYYGKCAFEFFNSKRFRTNEHARMWDAIKDRLKRFRSALKQAPKYVGIGLEGLPNHVENTARQLYQSLRKADLVKAEIHKSEGAIGVSGLPFAVNSSDPETSELYMMADKNAADYRRHFLSVAARVTRTEGQCAVFVSALDALRVQLLAHRLSGQDDSLGREQFVEKMSDIRTQLSSINSALLELELPGASPSESENHIIEG